LHNFKNPDWMWSGTLQPQETDLGVEYEFGPFVPTMSWKSYHAYISLTHQILESPELKDTGWKLEAGVHWRF